MIPFYESSKFYARRSLSNELIKMCVIIKSLFIYLIVYFAFLDISTFYYFLMLDFFKKRDSLHRTYTQLIQYLFTDEIL